MKFALALAALSSLAFTGASKAQTADPSVGRRLAATLCVDCHRIDATTPPKDATSQAPSFVDVARLPSTNELAIKVFLRSSHSQMPNFILTPEEIDSVAAYIVSLAGTKRQEK
ncbi:MAG: cytochrome C [Methylocystaceae bacterium]|nr:MAG: cytochrome C [Methylocystaceae bacterium]